MSTENIAKFVAAVRADDALQAQATTIFALPDGAARLASLSTEMGMDFTAEEFLASLPDRIEGELSENELGHVSGGRGTSPQCFGQDCGGSPPW